MNMQTDAGYSSLIIASEHGHCDIVKLLIEKGAQMNMQTNAGHSALMIASEYRHRDVVKLLLEKGSEVIMQANIGPEEDRHGSKVLIKIHHIEGL